MKTVTFLEDVALVSLKNCPADADFISRVLTMIADENIDVDMVSQTSPTGGKIDICFTVSDSDIEKLFPLTLLFKKEYPSVSTAINGNNCKISVHDDAMKNSPGYAAEVFKKVASLKAEIRLITTSEVDISLLVVNDYLKPLLEIL